MRTKALFFATIAAIVVSVSVSYYRYVVVNDYAIEAEIECDPYAESCFVYVCDPEAGEECSGNPEEDIAYYKLMHRNARHIPSCDPDSDGCDAAICPVGEPGCRIFQCDPSAGDGFACSDPIAYAAAHPVQPAEEEVGVQLEDDSPYGSGSEEAVGGGAIADQELVPPGGISDPGSADSGQQILDLENEPDL